MTHHRRLPLAALLLLGLMSALGLVGDLPCLLTGPVAKIVDGDTIDVELDGRRVRLRDVGINTPETKRPRKGLEPFGKEATAADRRLVEGQTIRLELDVQHWD